MWKHPGVNHSKFIIRAWGGGAFSTLSDDRKKKLIYCNNINNP